MALSVLSHVAAADSANRTNPSWTLPATINAGDLVLIAVGCGVNATISAGPTGFTRLESVVVTTVNILEIWAKVCDGTEGGTTASFTSGNTRAWVSDIYRISGGPASLASTVHSSGITSAGSAPPSISVTTASDGNLVVQFLRSTLTTAAPFAAPVTGGWAKQDEATNAGGTNPGAIVSATMTQSPAGATGTDAWSTSGSTSYAKATVAIPPGGAIANALTLSASSTATPALARATSVPRSGSSTATPRLVRASSLRRAAASTATAVLTRLIGKPLLRTATGTATVVRNTAAARTTGSTVTPSMATVSAFVRAFNALSTTVAAVRRDTNLTRTGTATGTATRTASSVFSRALTATSTALATLTRSAVLARTLTAVATGTATIRRTTAITRTAASIATAVIDAVQGLPASFARITSRTRAKTTLTSDSHPSTRITGRPRNKTTITRGPTE